MFLFSDLNSICGDLIYVSFIYVKVKEYETQIVDVLFNDISL